MDILFSTREEWLTMAIDEWNNRLFKQAGYDLNKRKLKISCGFPPGQRGNKKAFAVIDAKYSKDGNTELFINPGIDDACKAAEVVCLAAAGSCNLPNNGKGLAKVGIDTEGVERVATAIVGELGGYPHAAVDMAKLPRQSTRMHKCKCPDCGYTVRVSNKWLKVAVPDCPVHNVQMKTEE